MTPDIRLAPDTIKHGGFPIRVTAVFLGSEYLGYFRDLCNGKLRWASDGEHSIGRCGDADSEAEAIAAIQRQAAGVSA